MVREVKKSSHSFIKEKGFSKLKFEWQDGYGAFSNSQSAVPNVISNIQDQKEHHRKTTFQEEYQDFMNKFEIDHEDKYLFD